MKKAIGFAILALTLVFAAQAWAEHHEVTMTGEYIWNQGPTGDLKAVFAPSSENTWDVVFYFDFRDKARTYTGTATGSLDGELSGVVYNENKKRTFTFEGKTEEGTFQGNHEETTPGREGDTGTMTLSR